MIDRSVLLVHDVVNAFLDDGDAALAVVLRNVGTLVAAARTAGVPIVFAAPGKGDPAIALRPGDAPEKSVWGTPAADVPATVGILPTDTVLRKPRYGAFFGSAFGDYLAKVRRDTMIICGISLAGGVETSVRDAHNRDLRSILVADACLSRPVPDQGWGDVSSEEVAKVTLSVLKQRFARIASTAEICAGFMQVK